jgi:hypothetical protein
MKNKYRDCGLEVPEGYKIPGSRMNGERIIEIDRINIDYGCFKKTTEEKLRLKTEKAKSKNASN